jgi:dihydroorotate dehydrogenase (fumarate)
MMKLQTNFCGLELESPLMNAAGTCKTVDEVRKFAGVTISAIVAGSYTYNDQTGNAGNTYYSDLVRSVNSKGIPNGGREYLRANLPEMVLIARDAGKFLIVSVSGNTPDESSELVDIAVDGGADAVEVNLACPNLKKQSGVHKPIICFYPPMIDEFASRIVVPVNYPLGWKVSHYSNPPDRISVARQLVGHRQTRFLTGCNTYPNVYGTYSDGSIWIDPEYGGMGGAAVKPMAEAFVRAVHTEFPDLSIAGVGGVGCSKLVDFPRHRDDSVIRQPRHDGQDLMDYLNDGATVVQVATGYFMRGLSVFSDIMHEYTDMLEESEAKREAV